MPGFFPGPVPKLLGHPFRPSLFRCFRSHYAFEELETTETTTGWSSGLEACPVLWLVVALLMPHPGLGDGAFCLTASQAQQDL